MDNCSNCNKKPRKAFSLCAECYNNTCNGINPVSQIEADPIFEEFIYQGGSIPISNSNPKFSNKNVDAKQPMVTDILAFLYDYIDKNPGKTNQEIKKAVNRNSSLSAAGYGPQVNSILHQNTNIFYHEPKGKDKMWFVFKN